MDIEMNNTEAWIKASPEVLESRRQNWIGLPLRFAIYGWGSALIILAIRILIYFDKLHSEDFFKSGLLWFLFMSCGCNFIAVITGGFQLFSAAFQKPRPAELTKPLIGFIMGTLFLLITFILCWIDYKT
jgi:uncharacterized membrane protein